MATEYDGPWKEAIELFYEWFQKFFFPEAAAEIDWQRGWESLNKELQRILPEAAVGTWFSDALVLAYTPEGDTRYLHTEVQCQREDEFENRLDDYNCMMKLRFKHPIITQILLGDDSPTWLPNEYVHSCAGYEKKVKYPAVKILRFRGQEEELLKHANPIALLVVAHLLTLSTGTEEKARREGKLRLLKNVVDRKMDGEDTFHLSRLIDWMVDLPREGHEQVWEAMREYAQEAQMPFLSYPEQIGYDRGTKESLLKRIERALEKKFGAEGQALLPVIQQQELVVLEQLLDAFIDATSPATSPAEIRNWLETRQKS
jgi:hypothetical protein